MSEETRFSLKAGFPDENVSETGICQVLIGCVLGARRVFVFGVGFLFPGLVGVVVASCFVSGCLVSSVFSDVELLWAWVWVWLSQLLSWLLLGSCCFSVGGLMQFDVCSFSVN